MLISQMGRSKDVLFFVNRDSFPVNCPELDDFLYLVEENYDIEVTDVESPTQFFKQALSRAENHELVIPVTRNMFVRDRLRQEGVNLIVCL